MNLSELNQTIETKLEEVNRLIQEEGKKVLGEAFKEFFAANPAVKAIKWTQYTPYFNDGDPCEFSSNASYADILLGIPKEMVNSDNFYVNDEEDEVSTWVDTKGTSETKGIDEFLESLGNVKDRIYLAIFGDHTEVTAHVNGEFTVEEIDHD
jgi:hypothetical protein